MPTYDRLQGMVAQSMGGPKSYPVEGGGFLNPGTYTFTAPAPGYYKFVLWGGGAAAVQWSSGANGGGGGGSGAYCEITRAMAAGERATIIIGQQVVSGDGNLSSVTFADGKVVTAGGGKTPTGAQQVGGLGGTATGGDVNLNGSQGGSTNGTTGADGAAGLGTGGGPGGVFSASNIGGGAGAPANLPYYGGKGGSYSITSPLGPGIGAGGSGSGFTPGNGSQGAVLVQFLRPSQ